MQQNSFRQFLVDAILDLPNDALNEAFFCISASSRESVIGGMLKRFESLPKGNIDNFVQYYLNAISRSSYRAGGKELPWSVNFGETNPYYKMQILYLLHGNVLQKKVIDSYFEIIDRRALDEMLIKSMMISDVRVIGYRVGVEDNGR